MAEIAAAYPDENWPAFSPVEEEFEYQPWHELYFQAFDSLRYDRFYGQMGGEMPIYYTAISQYCRDHGIAGDDWRRFMTMINAIDAEHLKLRTESDGQGKPKDDADVAPKERR